jgi:hypothetical protein
MSQGTKQNAKARTAVRRLVTAVDRIIDAARQAEEARDQLLQNTKEQRNG